MSRHTFFAQACPICGRQLQIRIEYLGKQVACQHCDGRFDAHDCSEGEVSETQTIDRLLSRADELLATRIPEELLPEEWPPQTR